MVNLLSVILAAVYCNMPHTFSVVLTDAVDGEPIFADVDCVVSQFNV